MQHITSLTQYNLNPLQNYIKTQILKYKKVYIKFIIEYVSQTLRRPNK